MELVKREETLWGKGKRIVMDEKGGAGRETQKVRGGKKGQEREYRKEQLKLSVI